MPVVYYHQQEGNTCPVVHYMKWGLVPCFTKKNEKPDHFRMVVVTSLFIGFLLSFYVLAWCDGIISSGLLLMVCMSKLAF
jgi:hypothetical protein